MNVFLSYASEHVGLAARIASGLTQEGDDVFFDRESLPVGEGYHQRIRDAIEAADVFVFLVAPASLTPGSYAVAELEMAGTAAALGRPKLLPVMAAATPFEALPATLRGITVLQPAGDVVASVLAAAAEIRGDLRRSRVSFSIGVTNSGWMLTLFVIDPGPREIFVRFADEAEFRSTGKTNVPSFATGLPMPRMTITIPAFEGTRDLFVKYVDSRGRERGPYPIRIDAARAVSAATRDVLQMTRPWVAFLGDQDRRLLYFTHLLAFKYALKEIRYSLDDDSLSRRVRFTPARIGETGIDPDDEMMVEIPASTRCVYVQLTFVDGSRSDVERFP
jgi:hypothetical protein